MIFHWDFDYINDVLTLILIKKSLVNRMTIVCQVQIWNFGCCAQIEFISN